jgi:3',5'-cyclic-AMP phosphodiesterase
MPAIFYQHVNRRNFLANSSKAFAAFAFCIQVKGFAASASSPGKEVHLALLSDTHTPADPLTEYRKFFPSENLRGIVSQVIEARPEGVIVNGDAARATGELADYEEFKRLLAPLAEQTPIYIGLGNHDNRENFLKVFDKLSGNRQPVTDKHVLVIEHPVSRFILLDSLFLVNKVAGLLGKAQRDWLSEYLEKSDGRATVLFVHHTLGEGDGDLLDIERLYRLIQPHKKVKAIFYGHSHEYAFSRQQGVHLVNIPAVGYNFKDSEPVGWVDARFRPDGADLTLKAFAGNLTGNGKSTSLDWNS